MMGSLATRPVIARLLLGGTISVFSAEALAGNGLNDIAFGARSSGMAGADLAVARDTAALNINPSGLSQITRSALDFYAEPYINLSIRHTDELGNDAKPHAPYGLSIGGGYARRLPDSRVVLGIGFFAQGGAGFAYRNLITPFGTHDDTSAKLGSIKLAPGFAWQITDALSIGASSGINYSQAREKAFPDTSVQNPNDPAASFYGFRVDGLDGWSVNGKLGFRYRLDEKWVLAGVYTSKAPIKLATGTMKVDYDAAGFGRVTYRNASLKGLAVAQQAGIGASYRPNDAWLIAANLSWVDWSGALKSSTLSASDPDNQQLPQNLQNLSFTSALDWRDQYVIAAAAEYRYSEFTTVRFGVNYGRNPCPGGTLSPTLSALGEIAVAAGFTRRLSGPWELSGAAWYQLPKTVHYTNPNSPFGPNSSETFDGLVVNIAISRRR